MNVKRSLQGIILFTILQLMTGCAHNTRLFTKQDVAVKKGIHTITLPGSKNHEIELQYLGCSGFTISQDEESILLDPYFSNFRFAYVASTLIREKLKPNEKILNRIKDSIKVNPASVKSVLVTHAHYDHLIDVPWIYNKLLAVNKPPIYGNRSVHTLIKNLIPDSTQVKILDSTLSGYYSEGAWVRVSEKIRFLPVVSGHAPHWKMIKIFDGEACSPITKEEYSHGSRVQRWADGVNIAYLIEFIQVDTFRLFIQSAATCPPHGFPPHSYIKDHPIDLALLCMASFEYVCDYPNGILSYLRPRHIIINHWEDFFTPYSRGLDKGFKIVRATNGEKFIKVLDAIVRKYAKTEYPKEKYTVAAPLTRIKIKY